MNRQEIINSIRANHVEDTLGVSLKIEGYTAAYSSSMLHACKRRKAA